MTLSPSFLCFSLVHLSFSRSTSLPAIHHTFLYLSLSFPSDVPPSPLISLLSVDCTAILAVPYTLQSPNLASLYLILHLINPSRSTPIPTPQSPLRGNHHRQCPPASEEPSVERPPHSLSRERLLGGRYHDHCTALLSLTSLFCPFTSSLSVPSSSPVSPFLLLIPFSSPTYSPHPSPLPSPPQAL